MPHLGFEGAILCLFGCWSIQEPNTQQGDTESKVHQFWVQKDLVQPEDESQTSSDHKPFNKSLKQKDAHQNHQATQCHSHSRRGSAIEQFLGDQLSHPLNPKVQAFQGATDASNELTKVKTNILEACESLFGSIEPSCWRSNCQMYSKYQ